MRILSAAETCTATSKNARTPNTRVFIACPFEGERISGATLRSIYVTPTISSIDPAVDARAAKFHRLTLFRSLHMVSAFGRANKEFYMSERMLVIGTGPIGGIIGGRLARAG